MDEKDMPRLSVASIDVGFDLRETGHTVAWPDHLGNGPIKVEFNAPGDPEKSTRICATKQEAIELLIENGYEMSQTGERQ